MTTPPGKTSCYHETLDLFAGRMRIRFVVAALELGDNPLERLFEDMPALLLFKEKRNFLIA